MNEMVERLARAYHEWNVPNCQDLFDADSEHGKVKIKLVRILIAEMRKPTEAMVKAGTITWDPMDGGPIRPVFDPTKPYQAMIDEALK